jgi:hypothetical protein
MSHFDVESQSADGRTEPVFRFLDELSEDGRCCGGEGLLILYVKNNDSKFE